MKKILTLLPIVFMLLSCTATGDFSTSGTASNNPLYVQWTNDIDTIATVNQTDVTGWPGLLADDQHIIDAEAILAIENDSGTIINAGDLRGIFTASLANLTLPSYSNIGGTIYERGADHNIEGSYHFDIVGTGSARGIRAVTTTGSVTGWYNTWKHLSTSPADGDVIFREYWVGNDNTQTELNYGYMDVTSEDVTNGTENGGIAWFLMNDGGTNQVMTLDSTGNLSVDLGYYTFDEHDDALLLKQAISGGNTELLVKAGVVKRGYNITESGELIEDGYMVNVQQFLALLSGGIYQNRDKIDLLEARIIELEKLLGVK